MTSGTINVTTGTVEVTSGVGDLFMGTMGEKLTPLSLRVMPDPDPVTLETNADSGGDGGGGIDDDGGNSDDNCGGCVGGVGSVAAMEVRSEGGEVTGEVLDE